MISFFVPPFFFFLQYFVFLSCLPLLLFIQSQVFYLSQMFWLHQFYLYLIPTFTSLMIKIENACSFMHVNMTTHTVDTNTRFVGPVLHLQSASYSPFVVCGHFHVSCFLSFFIKSFFIHPICVSPTGLCLAIIPAVDFLYSMDTECETASKSVDLEACNPNHCFLPILCVLCICLHVIFSHGFQLLVNRLSFTD